MKNRARSLVYTTGLPPAVVAGAIAAVEVIASDKDRVVKPLRHARTFCEAVGLAPPQSPIVPVIVGDEAAALAASTTLEEAGYLVTPIRPPTVPAGTSRLRITFTAEHSDEQVEGLANALKRLISKGMITRTAAEG
jgi:8-amino-7-oxononanoate synthase